MFKRILKPLESNSFFLFGARGTGKSTLINELLGSTENYLIDLLDTRIYDEYLLNPGLLLERFQKSEKKYEWIIIDEVQRIPNILNEVHKLIFENNQKFALTGSSARKLKRGGVNLLAGRAFTYNLYPLTHLEFADSFNLTDSLQWGSLPQIVNESNLEARNEYLFSYINTYLKEEVISEQLIRKIDGFRRFLKVAATANGKILVYDKIAKDVGLDSTTVKTYFEILSDTLIGFFLPSYHSSIRKQQRQAPKFYFFDCGVQRALLGIADQKIVPTTYGYGIAFEHFIILEIIRLCSYHRKNYEFYYLRTKDDAEIDLIIERPGLTTVIAEIKSSSMVASSDIGKLSRFKKDFPGCEAIMIADEKLPRFVDGIEVLPWKNAITKIIS